MPSYIVKIHPDRDQYVYWSTVVDAPVSALGTRAEMTDYLLRHANHAGPETAADARFDRADKTGTSSVDGFYGWDDPDKTFDGTFIVEQRGVVKREDIPELVRCMEAGLPYPHILHPFEDGRIVTWDAEGNKVVIEGTEDLVP